ncbi:MAG: insulinase family protein [Desulfuromonadales bacterium]|nr:insulinase family protein [Desulfuromonadales bacterium]
MSEYLCDTLDNGLRVVSAPMPHHHSAEILLCIGVGSRYESTRLGGISHFLEHMLFKGTSDYPTGLALERAFEAVGGSANAATDSETTCFHSRVHPKHIDEGMALFASMLQRPLFNDLEMERRVILEEALGDLNESGRQINSDNIVAGLLFPKHALGRPTVGSHPSIERLTEQQLRRHHASYYTPSNAILSVAGPVEHQQIVRAANACFADWDGPVAPTPKAWSANSDETSSLRWVRDAGSQVSLQLAFLLPGRDSENAVNLRVLRRLLGWGGMSRLMWRLREELGLTYAVDASLALYADAGVLAIDLAVSVENLVAASEAILQLIGELHDDPVEDNELDHVLNCYRCDLDYSRDQVDEMALRYAWGELTGNRRTIADDLAGIETVTAAGLRRTANELLTPANLRGAVVGPYRTRDRKAVEALVADWQPLS